MFLILTNILAEFGLGLPNEDAGNLGTQYKVPARAHPYTSTGIKGSVSWKLRPMLLYIIRKLIIKPLSAYHFHKVLLKGYAAIHV